VPVRRRRRLGGTIRSWKELWALLEKLAYQKTNWTVRGEPSDAYELRPSIVKPITRAPMSKVSGRPCVAVRTRMVVIASGHAFASIIWKVWLVTSRGATSGDVRKVWSLPTSTAENRVAQSL
jgi:hypothetical protein